MLFIPSKDFLVPDEEPPISIRTCPGVGADGGCSPGHSFLGFATDSTGVLGNLDTSRPALIATDLFDLELDGSLLPGG